MTSRIKRPLIQRYAMLKPRLEKEIDNCNAVTARPQLYTPGIVKTAKKYRPLLKATLALLRDAFNGEDDDLT